MNTLEMLGKELDKCVKCGTCRSICPTFRVIARETACARGKLTLISSYIKGELGLTEDYVTHIKECTMCGGCRDSCPNGVDTTGIMNAARADAVEKQGLPLAAGFILKNIVDSSRLMPLAMKFASKVQGLFFKDSISENGLISRFTLPVVGGGRLVPQLAKRFFMDLPEVRELYGGHLKAPGKEPHKGHASKPVTVAFYAGCGVNYLMPEVGTKSIEVIRRTGADVAVPSGQACCGMPAYYMGDVATAKSLALKNIEEFERYDCDYIVTSCATCSHGLKNVFKELLSSESPEMKKRVDDFCSKVRDVTEFLAGRIDLVGGGRIKKTGEKKIVTYHDPCHLNRNQGIRDEPRALLAQNPELKFKQMRFPCSCCGLGGGLSYTNYELSIEITRRKAESVRDSGAQVLATACPGCIVQLRDGMHRYGVDAEVRHVVELL